MTFKETIAALSQKLGIEIAVEGGACALSAKAKDGTSVTIVDADRRGVIGHFLARRALELPRQVLGLPPCPDERVCAEQSELDRVVEIIERLPPRERACVKLKYLLDKSSAQIALETDLSPGSVRKYISRALKRIRKELEESGV